MELDVLWLGLDLFKEFDMTGGTHQLNALFHVLSAQEYRRKNLGDPLIMIISRGLYLKVYFFSG